MDDGIGILGINQCEQLENETDQEKQDDLVKEHTMNFVTGGNPTWEIFMLSKPVKSQMSSKMPNCLVERVQTKRIQEKIKDMGNIDKKSVAMANILHNPGAGATTIGKHVLWNLKEQFRCAYLDGDVIKDVPMKKLSEMILLFRKIKEKDSKATGIEGPGCKTVLLFLDNTSFEYVKTLQRNLDQVVETEKIKYNKTIVILLYAERSANLDIERGSDYDSPNIFKVKSQIDKKEQKSFSVKLGLLDKTNIPPESMLTFVMMAEGFNEDSERVKRDVQNILRDIHHYPRQEKLLMVLAIYKFYSDGNLPVSLCDSILGHSKSPILERLCCHVKPFVEERKEYDEGYGSFSVLQVTHLPIAKQAMKELFSKNKVDVQAVLFDFLDTDSVKQRFLKDKIRDDIRRLLTSRTSTDQNKLRYSKLILDIQRDQSSKKARDLLEKGFNTLHEDALIAQTLARFLNDEKEFKEAKEWAQKAIDSGTGRYTFIDTLGRIYKAH